MLKILKMKYKYLPILYILLIIVSGMFQDLKLQ